MVSAEVTLEADDKDGAIVARGVELGLPLRSRFMVSGQSARLLCPRLAGRGQHTTSEMALTLAVSSTLKQMMAAWKKVGSSGACHSFRVMPWKVQVSTLTIVSFGVRKLTAWSSAMDEGAV